MYISKLAVNFKSMYVPGMFMYFASSTYLLIAYMPPSAYYK